MAGEAAGLVGGDLVAGGEGGDAEVVEEGVEVHGDDDLDGGAAVVGQAGGVEVLDQGGEGLAEELAVGDVSAGDGVAAVEGGEVVAAGCGDRSRVWVSRVAVRSGTTAVIRVMPPGRDRVVRREVA